MPFLLQLYGLLCFLVYSSQASLPSLSTSISIIACKNCAISPVTNWNIDVRGGQKRSKTSIVKKKSLPYTAEISDTIANIKPVTRYQAAVAVALVLMEVLGVSARRYALASDKILQVWRPFTSLTYLGPLHLSTAFNLYFLLLYGQALESHHGTAAHVWYLLLQSAMLSGIGLLTGLPYLAHSLLAAIVHTASLINPMQKMRFYFGIPIVSWQLPYMMMLVDCLAYQSPLAAVPHLIGLITSSIHHYFNVIYPQNHRKNPLEVPEWLRDLFPESNASIEAIDYRRKDKKKDRTRLFPFRFPIRQRKRGIRLGSVDDEI